jgi:hypothetical protein
MSLEIGRERIILTDRADVGQVRYDMQMKQHNDETKMKLQNKLKTKL